jgi:metallo-beta-lactamase family protein
MHLEFHGGAGGVTGSHTVLDTGKGRLAVDAGTFQGGDGQDELNRRGFCHNVRGLQAVILTHAHIDHSGRLPYLVKQGYGGPIFATMASADLCDVMLRDSARLMEEESIHGGRHPDQGLARPPLYDEADVERTLRRFRPVRYGEPFGAAGVPALFRDAGHILGSATLELELGGRRLVMSGDLGRPGSPILRNPEPVAEADWLVLESTYGDREHADKQDRGRRLYDIIRETVGRGGNVVIPAFAVGRTQDILYELNHYSERGLLKGVPVFVDSPMAISASEIYRRHPECYDSETKALLSRGDDPLSFPGMRHTRSREDSKAINALRDPHIVISASGMCAGGRVVHHLAHNIERPESTILFVGYQAEGTLGRRIKDRTGPVRLLGKEFQPRAQVEVLDAFSAHADRSELLDWLASFKRFPETVFLNHGEEASSASLAEAVRSRFGADVRIPARGSKELLE